MSDDCVFTKCAWRLREAHWSTHGGQFMAVTLPDGKLLGNPKAAAGANADAN